MNYIFRNEEGIKRVKKDIENNHRLKFELMSLTEKFLKTEPLSVTFHKSPAVSGNIHDFFSEGTYWWPDPENPNGPYIRRDGETNPDRFGYHQSDMNLMANAVSTLVLSWLYLGDENCHKKAMELLKVWFLDEDTKMNPHLEYAQAIRGICSGRSIGIIDTSVLIKVVDAADILEKSGLYIEEIGLLKEWFSQYLNWMNTSPNGLEEKNYFNNHSNWWNTQAAFYAAFTGNETLLEECFDKFRNDIIVNQLDSNGRFTDEIKRTRSYTYTMMNTDACALICEIARNRGVDLWNYTAENGNSLKKAIEFFKPFYENPFLWKYNQISAKGSYGVKAAFKLAALRYDDSRLDSINKERGADMIPCRVLSHVGYVDLM